MDKKKLVACAVLANEAPYLPEWLAYHRLAGVDHFVLYDNGSSDDPAHTIRGLPLAEHVTLVPWPQRPGHASAYRHFIDIFSPGFEWAAFLDVDEFLLPLNSGTVAGTLEWLSSAAAVLVHRRVFGPPAWQARPWGLVIETCDRRAPDDYPANRHVRTIARCSGLLDVTDDPHEFRVSGQLFNTAGHLAPNRSVQAQPCYLNLVINHYAARSRQDWQAKLERNDAAADAVRHDQAAPFDELAAACQVYDTTIQAFAAPVRQLLGLDPPAPSAFDGDPLLATAPASLAPASPMGPASPVAPVSPVAPASPMSQPSPVVVVPAVPAPFVPTQAARAHPAPAPAAPAQAAPAPAAPAPAAPAHAAPAHTAPTQAAPAWAVPAPVAAPAPVPQSVVAAVQAALTPYAAALHGTRPEQSPQPDKAASMPVDVAPSWVRRGQDAQERTGGLGLVFRDRSRAGEHWLAALRGAAVGAIDPAFLMDEYDRIRDFPTDAAARAACDAALAQGPVN